MRFALFATGALAATTFQKRQLSVVTDAISAISDATTTLREGIGAFQTIADAGDLQTQADAVVTAINDGNSAVEAIDTLGPEAASLAGPIQDLAALVQGTVDDLIAKKPTFVEAEVGGVVLTAATTLRDAANTFRTTVLSKVPENLQDLGNTISQPISDALDQAVNEFSDQEGGSPPTDGGETPTTTGGEPVTTTDGGDSYTTAPPATTTTGGAGGSATSPVATYTGAAIANAANGYGAMAMAVLAGAAML